MHKHWRPYKYLSNSAIRQLEPVIMADETVSSRKDKPGHHSTDLDKSINDIDDLKLRSVINDSGQHYFVRLAYLYSDLDVKRKEKELRLDIKNKFNYFLRYKLTSLLGDLKSSTGYVDDNLNEGILEDTLDFINNRCVNISKEKVKQHTQCLNNPIVCFYSKMQDIFPTFIITTVILINTKDKVLTVNTKLTVMYYNIKIKQLQFNEEEVLTEFSIQSFEDKK